MGGSSARPADVLGAMRPPKAALINDRRTRLLVARHALTNFARWANDWQGLADRPRIDAGMLLLTNAQASLDHRPRADRHGQLGPLLKQLKTWLNQEGYTARVRGQLPPIFAELKRLDREARQELGQTQPWRCPSCGATQFKLIEDTATMTTRHPGRPLKQCQRCQQLDAVPERRR